MGDAKTPHGVRAEARLTRSSGSSPSSSASPPAFLLGHAARAITVETRSTRTRTPVQNCVPVLAKAAKEALKVLQIMLKSEIPQEVFARVAPRARRLV